MSDTGKPQSRRSYRGKAHTERSQERRERLIAAGIQVVGGLGLRRATVKAVCTEAGLTERYFYESFAGMEALLAACYRQTADSVRDEVQAAVQRQLPDTDAALRAGLSTYFRRIKAHPEAARLVLFEIEGVSEAIDAVYRATLAEWSQLIEAMLFEPVRPAAGLSTSLLATALMGAIYQLAKQWVQSGCARPASHLVHNAMALMAGVVLQVQASPPGKTASPRKG